MSCSQCEGIESTFDDESVRKELLFYDKDGPDDTTIWLIDSIKEQGVLDASLLDIGGGIGAIQHELLKDVAKNAVHVDGSSAYIEGAKKAAKSRDLDDQIEWHHGDFVELAETLQNADIVTLDRVICCYDDMPELVVKSVAKANRIYALVYPRDRWFLRLGFRIANRVQRLFGNQFQIFVHPTAKVEEIIAKSGFQRAHLKESFIWQMALFAK